MSNFSGFEQANTTPVPDVLFDELLAKLSGAELKVLLYIIRRTAGFKKATDAISLSQLQEGIVTKDGRRLDYGCGIKRRDVITKALVFLEENHYIIAHREMSDQGDHATTVYGVCFKNRVVTVCDQRGSHQNGLPVVTNGDYGSHQNGLPVVTVCDPQVITVSQETDQQETVIQGGTSDASASANAPRAVVPLSENLSLEDTVSAESAVPPLQQQIAPTKRVSARQQKPPSRLSVGEPEAALPARRAPVAPGPSYSPEAGRIMDLWDSTFARAQPRTAANIEAAEQLVPCQPTAEELKTCRIWLFTTDDPKRPWFRKKGVSLADVAKNFSNWQSLQDAAPRQPDKPVEEDPYSWEAMKRRSDARQKEREFQEVLV